MKREIRPGLTGDYMDHERRRKITLVIPNSRWFGKRMWLCLPYAALLLTAILKKRYDFSIIDANGGDLSMEEVEDWLRDLAPEAVLITAGSVEYHRQAHAAAAAARRALGPTPVIMGGIYPTVLPEEAAKDDNVDWLFMHHAEERIEEFLELVLTGRLDEARRFPGVCFRDGSGVRQENPPTSHIGDVKEMVRPDYSLVDVTPYIVQNSLDYQFNSDRPAAFVITSYGCPCNCLFCASRTISGRRTVYRPVEHVLEEIDYLVREHGVRNIVFLDDALLMKRARLIEIMDGMSAMNVGLAWKAASVAAWQLDADLLGAMKASGCQQITISVESGSQRVLTDVIGKPLRLEVVPGIVKTCRELGIVCGANFVVGMPGETWEDIRQTFRFAEECDFDVSHFHIATPLPKTDLYHICKEKGYLPEDFSFVDPRFIGYAHGFITTEEFTPLELSVLRAYEWDRINFSTPEKVERMARVYCSTPERLAEHRKKTRRRLGLHIEGMSDAEMLGARMKLVEDAARAR